MANVLATAPQLWRLNKEGKLRISTDEDPVTSLEADRAIKSTLSPEELVAALERQGIGED